MPLNLLRQPGALPKLVGHRGACELAPENTLVSFERAFVDGADIVEMDLRFSSDRQVMVIHDATVDRTSDGTGIVASMSRAELQRLDAGAWFAAEYAGVRIPTLVEVCEWARGRIGLMLEFKYHAWGAFDPALVPAVLEIVRQAQVYDQIVGISFEPRAMMQLKNLAPDVQAGAMPDRDRWLQLAIRVLRWFPALSRWQPFRRTLLRPLRWTLGYGLDLLAPNIDAVTPSLVDAAHAAGIPVSAGGVAWDYPAALAMGLDTLSSNNPGVIRHTYLSSRAV